MKARRSFLANRFVLMLAALFFTIPFTSLAQYDDYPQDDGNYENRNYNNDDYSYNGDDDYYNERGSADVNINIFYNQLSPYGRWISSPSYGRVWVYNEPGFRPYYSHGHWAYTSYGWTWVSNYNWGWAPFHYGRWVYDSFNGWMWVPGYSWGPAWVAWRSGGGYYGWAPLSPGVSLNVGFSFGYGISASAWVFSPTRYITSPYVGRYCVDRSRNTTIINNTTVINNYTTYNNRRYVAGPRRVDVERTTNRRINVVEINNASKPGETRMSGNRVTMYRPNTSAGTLQTNRTTGKEQIQQSTKKQRQIAGKENSTNNNIIQQRTTVTNNNKKNERQIQPGQLNGENEERKLNNAQIKEREQRVKNEAMIRQKAQAEKNRVDIANRQRLEQQKQNQQKLMNQQRMEQAKQYGDSRTNKASSINKAQERYQNNVAVQRNKQQTFSPGSNQVQPQTQQNNRRQNSIQH